MLLKRTCSNFFLYLVREFYSGNNLRHSMDFLVNDNKGNGISGHDHYIFCPSGMLGTPCTA